jgi:hypothetical protein
MYYQNMEHYKDKESNIQAMDMNFWKVMRG